MNEIIGKLPLIGELTINSTLVFYDGEPMTFICVNADKDRFIAHTIASGDNSEWILTQVSDKRIREMVYNKIPYRVVLSEPEDGFLWRVKKTKNNNELSCVVYPTPEIPIDLLPQDNDPLEAGPEEIACCLEKLAQYQIPNDEKIKLIDQALTRITTKHSDVKEDVDFIRQKLPLTV